MLYDVFDLSRPGTAHDGPAVSLFRAQLRAGVLSIPDYASAEVLKAAGGAS
jgi:CRISPR-associated protein Cas5d